MMVAVVQKARTTMHFFNDHSTVSMERGKILKFSLPRFCFFALQIRVDGTTKNTLEYEIVQVVDTGPILRDMAFSMDHEHLYIMSEKQVRNSVSPWCFESF